MTDSLLTAFDQLASNSQRRSKISLVRQHFDRITELQRNGHSLAEICDAFQQSGIKMSVPYLSTALTRVRQKQDSSGS